MQEYSHCSCGCTYPKLKKIVGRTIDVFHTKDGAKVDGAFFIYQFYFRNWVKNYQVIQESLEQIVIKLVKKDKVPQEDLAEIEKNVKHVMGKDCEVVFEFVPQIEKTKTGKFLYTYSKVKEPPKKRAVA
jgi:phenylacetate-CoA ligase